MDTSFLWLCEISTAMFLGSMLAGIIPLKLAIAGRKMRWCTIFGAGLLIGTAFSVIIPEGIETLYNAKIVETRPSSLPMENISRTERDSNNSQSSYKEKRHVHGQHTSCEESRTQHINAKLGFSLTFGFLFMLLVDQMGNQARGKCAARGRIGVSATIGLVVHAAVDGVAVGTSSFSDEESLKWIVFFAILLHKMPAAFGLVTFLSASRISKKKIYRHLTVFALAAPLAAIITFWLVSWVEWLSSQVAIGCLMLFSAGTFMYVATIHVIPELNRFRSEVDNEETETEAMIVVDVQSLRASNGHYHAVGPSFSPHDVLFILLGAVLPAKSPPLKPGFLLNKGHAQKAPPTSQPTAPPAVPPSHAQQSTLKKLASVPTDLMNRNTGVLSASKELCYRFLKAIYPGENAETQQNASNTRETRKTQKADEAKKVALVAVFNAEPQQPAQNEKKQGAGISCRLCSSQIYPANEEYFEYTCGREIGKETCSFKIHKQCLNEFYKKHRQAPNKSQWKDTPCITTNCEEKMLAIYVVLKDGEKKPHIKSTVTSTEAKKAGMKMDNEVRRIHNKKEKEKKERKKAEKDQTPEVSKSSEEQTPEVEPTDNIQKEIPSGSHLKISVPPVSSLPVKILRSPVEKSAENPLRRFVKEVNTVHLEKKKDVMEEKYGVAAPNKNAKGKERKKNKPVVVKYNMIPIEATAHSSSRMPSTTDLAEWEGGFGREVLDLKTYEEEFAAQIEAKLQFPKPGTHEASSYEANIVSTIEHLLEDLVANCPRCPAGEARPASDLLRALEAVTGTVGQTGVLDDSQAVYLRELFNADRQDENSYRRLKLFVRKLKYFDVLQCREGWKYFLNQDGQDIQSIYMPWKISIKDAEELAMQTLEEANEFWKPLSPMSSNFAIPSVPPNNSGRNKSLHSPHSSFSSSIGTMSLNELASESSSLCQSWSSANDETVNLLLDKTGSLTVENSMLIAENQRNEDSREKQQMRHDKENKEKDAEVEQVRKALENATNVLCNSALVKSMVKQFQKNLLLVTNNIKHCNMILISLSNGKMTMNSTKAVSIRQEILDVLSRNLKQEKTLRENLQNLSVGVLDTQPLDSFPKLSNVILSILQDAQTVENIVHRHFAMISDRVKKLAVLPGGSIPNDEAIKVEMFKYLHQNDKSSFNPELAIQEIASSLKIARKAVLAVDHELNNNGQHRTSNYSREQQREENSHTRDDVCEICHDEFLPGEKVIRHLPGCGQLHHYECLHKWHTINRTCPHCQRTYVNQEDFPPL